MRTDRTEQKIEARNDPSVTPTPNGIDKADGAVEVNNIDIVVPVDNCNITDFVNGKHGQTISVYSTVNNTVAGGRITRLTGNPLTAARIYRFTFVEFANGTLIDKWIEHF